MLHVLIFLGHHRKNINSFNSYQKILWRQLIVSLWILEYFKDFTKKENSKKASTHQKSKNHILGRTQSKTTIIKRHSNVHRYNFDSI